MKPLNRKGFISLFYTAFGAIYLDQGRYEAAENMLKKALQFLPTNTNAKLNLALVYFATGQFYSTRKIFSEISKSNQPIAKLHYNLGALDFFEGKIESARANLNKALSLKPHYEKAETLKKVIGAHDQEPRQAVKVLEKAVEKEPQNVMFYAMLGSAHYKAGDPKSAIATYEEGLEKAGSSVVLYSLLGLTYLKFEDFGTAERIFQKGREIYPDVDVFYFSLGEVYKRQNKFEEAENFYKKAIQINANHFLARMALLSMYIRQYRDKEAESELLTLASIPPPDKSSGFLLGDMLERVKLFKEANIVYENLLKLNPSDREIRERLDRITNLMLSSPMFSAKDETTLSEPSLESYYKEFGITPPREK